MLGGDATSCQESSKQSRIGELWRELVCCKLVYKFHNIFAEYFQFGSRRNENCSVCAQFSPPGRVFFCLVVFLLFQPFFPVSGGFSRSPPVFPVVPSSPVKKKSRVTFCDSCSCGCWREKDEKKW